MTKEEIRERLNIKKQQIQKYAIENKIKTLGIAMGITVFVTSLGLGSIACQEKEQIIETTTSTTIETTIVQPTVAPTPEPTVAPTPEPTVTPTPEAKRNVDIDKMLPTPYNNSKEIKELREVKSTVILINQEIKVFFSYFEVENREVEWSSEEIGTFIYKDLFSDERLYSTTLTKDEKTGEEIQRREFGEKILAMDPNAELLDLGSITGYYASSLEMNETFSRNVLHLKTVGDFADLYNIAIEPERQIYLPYTDQEAFEKRREEIQEYENNREKIVASLPKRR